MAKTTDKSLESWIWDAACSIRGAKDAPKYKDYILPLIFTKRLSDVFDDELNRIAAEVGSRKKAFQLVKADHKLVRFYLPLVLAIGYRVRSPRGTQFRQWATTHLREYLVKGFVMDDERLKNPGGWDYFDELLARIREIRASKKRFYQKVRDLFALSSDYQAREKEIQVFFAA